MTFFVIETQTNAGVGSAIVTTYTDEKLARQKYHEVMSAASVSSVEKHGCVVLTEDLFQVECEVAPRTAQPEPQA